MKKARNYKQLTEGDRHFQHLVFSANRCNEDQIAWLFIQSLADRYIQLGHGEYLKWDDSLLYTLLWDVGILSAVQSGCDQILDGRGSGSHHPILGLSSFECCRLMELFHCYISSEKALNEECSSLKKLDFKHKYVPGVRLSLYIV